LTNVYEDNKVLAEHESDIAIYTALHISSCWILVGICATMRVMKCIFCGRDTHAFETDSEYTQKICKSDRRNIATEWIIEEASHRVEADKLRGKYGNKESEKPKIRKLGGHRRESDKENDD